MLNSNILSTPALRFQEALSKVFHDATLYGDGTRSNPLRIIGGGTLPDQSGHAGEFLTTDGSVLSWDTPGGGGAYLPLDGTGDTIEVLSEDSIWKTVPNVDNWESGIAWNKILSAPNVFTTTSGFLTLYAYPTGSDAGASISLSPEESLVTMRSKSYSSTLSSEITVQNGGVAISTITAAAETRNILLPATSGEVSVDFTNNNGGYNFISTTGGLVVPRMDGTQISALVSPMNGGVLYDTDFHKVKVFLNGGWYTVLDSSITLGLDKGGTSASLSASNGGIFYSTASAGAILSGTATASKMLLSGATAAPTWSTSTIPTSAGATVGKVLRSNGTNYALSGTILLDAGTTTAGTAPIKFTSGTNMTTPENGAVEYDGTNFFVTSASTRYTMAKVLTGSATLDFPNTVRLNSADLTITVTGAATGDPVILGVPTASAIADGVYTAWVSATNTVTVRFSNVGLTLDRDPASGVFKVSVLKY